MHIIAGLGNPGLSYRKSRHNAGFMAIDELSRLLHVKPSKRAHRSLICECSYNGEKLILLKPLTFMNLSGEAVAAVLKYYRLSVKDLIVIYDDIDLSAGRLRIRASGSAGTHNGMRSIIASLGGEEGFSRIRIGVGRQGEGENLAKFVLSTPSKAERAILDEAYKKAANAALMIANGKLSEAQAEFNGKG